MAGSGNELQTLRDWVVDLTDLQIICINRSFNIDIHKMNLNTFAQAKVKTSVGSSNLYNFGACVHQQFPNYDPQDAGESPGDNTTFADLTDIVAPLDLQAAATQFVMANVSSPTKLTNKTPLAQLFSADQWAVFKGQLQTTNLDAVLGNPLTIPADLDNLYAQKALGDLKTYLTSIQATPAGGR